MLVIQNKDHFRNAYHFAKELGKESKHTFLRSIRTLNRLKKNAPSGTVLHIFPDWVKHSFYWSIHRPETGERWFNGGMILHGFEETFSVELDPERYPHWSIHT